MGSYADKPVCDLQFVLQNNFSFRKDCSNAGSLTSKVEFQI